MTIKSKTKTYTYKYFIPIALRLQDATIKKLKKYAAGRRWPLSRACSIIIEQAFKSEVLP